MRKTNPIWRGVGRGRPTHKETIVQNKAKLGQDGTSGGRRIRRGQSCETKPISAVAAVGSPNIPAFHHSTIPVRCHLCKTNPIWHPGQAGGVPDGAKRAKQSQFPATPGGMVPGGRGPRDKCAKRTQSFDCGLKTELRPDRPACGRLGPTRAVCTNKPNSARLGQGQVPGGRKMRNKAKLGRTRASGGRRAGGACCAKQSQSAAGRAGTSRTHRAKQSQFLPGRCRARTPNPRSGRGQAPRGAEGNRAKRSQFQGSSRSDGCGIRHPMPATPVAHGKLDFALRDLPISPGSGSIRLLWLHPHSVRQER
jgi:hypothetical protein